MWKRIVLSLLLPFFLAAAVILYDLLRIETISRRVTHLELADDINLTLLELRRYEKNILLFNDSEDRHIFFENLDKIHKAIQSIENEFLSELSRTALHSLLDTLSDYEQAADDLLTRVEEQHRLEQDIRPLGRTLEQTPERREAALDIRRHEKNYLIYREEGAVARLEGLAARLAQDRPDLAPAVQNYLRVFRRLVRNSEARERSLSDMRNYGRAIQKITLDLSTKERQDIEQTILRTKKIIAISLLLLMISLIVIGYLFSKSVVKMLRSMEQGLHSLETGSYEHIPDGTGRPPAEIASLIDTYNHTIDALGSSKAELEHTLKKLEDVNRELIDRQDEIVEIRKLTAMRLLASEIAHEVNNPLSSLTMFLGLLHEDMPDTDARRDMLSLMLKEANRCQEVVRELSSFARKDRLTYREIDPAKLVLDAVQVVKHQQGPRNIDVVTTLNNLPGTASVDPILMHQALVNILSNAYQFTPDGGIIEIHGRSERYCMTFVVKDRGAGIAEDHLPYIFEPFFSTRKEGGGTGLGLAITKKIIERHNGCIWVESRLGTETVFTIKMPIEREESCPHEH